MALGDYILCCECECKLIYDGDRGQREWWHDRWGKDPQIKCPDCEQPAQDEPAFYRHEDGHLMTPDRAKFIGLDLNDLQPLYTRPQARESLTDEQRSWIVATCVTPRQIIDLVEKMHGIKGEA